jgi:hypothetical protein
MLRTLIYIFINVVLMFTLSKAYMMTHSGYSYSKSFVQSLVLTSVTITRAMAPVAADIIPWRPPNIEMIIAMQNDAYSPTIGSTPQMMANDIASGISASATVMPASMSPLMLPNHDCLMLLKFNLPLLYIKTCDIL